jgi:hypothetical protein
LCLIAPGCDSGPSDAKEETGSSTPRFNLAHLDRLGEEVSQNGESLRIIHIYSEAPDYEWVGDEDEGIAALDDAARAAVVYLHHFEYTGNVASVRKAKQLLRFIMSMQRPDGLFFNFVWDARLNINETHVNSRADAFGWWASRGVWALGLGVRVLQETDPELAQTMAGRVQLTFPYLRDMLSHYGQYATGGGRRMPRWLVSETGSDATSELLLGLVAYQAAVPDAEVADMIARFAEGVALMQYGSMNSFPFGAHASSFDTWHGWGNSQTQALSEAGITASAEHEALHFYPRLLVEGWLYSFSLDDPGVRREFEQIAYATRGVAVGLVRLFEASGDIRYAKMAGLAASWLTGNNPANAIMYDGATGRGFDGIGGPDIVNRNSGAESTIESLFIVLEVGRHPEAQKWFGSTASPSVHLTREGVDYAYRVFTAGTGVSASRLGLVMNLTDQKILLLEDADLDLFLAG